MAHPGNLNFKTVELASMYIPYFTCVGENFKNTETGILKLLKTRGAFVASRVLSANPHGEAEGKLLAFRPPSCRYHNGVGLLPAGSAGEDAATEPLPPASRGSCLLPLGASRRAQLLSIAS